MNVVMIGAGLMGSQIGCEYALADHSVTFVARSPDAASSRIRDAFALATKVRSTDADEAQDTRDRVGIVQTIAEAPDEVELVVESIVESFDAKVDVLGDAANRWPEAILASNTSSLSITALGEACAASNRVIGTHYWNPPLLMPLVEVIRGEETTPGIVRRVMQALKSMGKRPVFVKKDVPGFVWNRLQLALLREAAWIVENGVATPEVVDEIVRDGLARRWRLTGPFETVALGGPDTFTRIAANLFPVLSQEKELHQIGRWLPAAGETLTKIKQRRDQGLLDELREEQLAKSAED